LKASVFFLSSVLLFSFALPIVTQKIVWAEQTPKMYIKMIETLNNTLSPGALFHAAVELSNIALTQGLVGIEFDIWWDSSVIRALNMTDVVFSEVTPETESSNINASQEVGDSCVYYNFTFANITRALDGGYAPISGNHTVAIITFEAVNPGDNSLTISISNLYDQYGNLITHDTFGYDLRICAWQYIRIPYVAYSDWSIDGKMTEDVWKQAFHFHGSLHNGDINLPLGRDLVYDLYLLGSNKSLYIAVTITNNDFWTDGYEADILEAEINSRNDGCFSAEVQNPDGYSGNALREIRATVSGLYTNYYFVGYTKIIDPSQNGNMSYTFSGPRENGAAGNYCYEMQIPFNTSDSHDPVFKEGNPFAMMIRYTDYVPPTDNGTIVQGWIVPLILRSFLLTVQGDLNGDLTVDIYDAITFALVYGKSVNQSAYDEMADFNRDGTIDIYDALVLAGNYGRHGL
jgi:hypothetical protein